MRATAGRAWFGLRLGPARTQIASLPLCGLARLLLTPSLLLFLRRHTFVLELDWLSLSLVLLVDGRPWSAVPISFGPHARLPAEEQQEVRQRLAAGWQHLYLFTWLEATDGQAEDEAPPEVEVGPIWLEDESPAHAPTGASTTVLPDLDPVDASWFGQTETGDNPHA